MTTTSPAMQLSQMIISLWVPQVVHATAELGIADVLAAGPLAAGAVAARLGSHPDATERLLRAMSVLGLVTLDGDRFELTALGRCLESDHPTSRRAWSRVMGGPMVWQSWGKLVECVRTGQPAVSDVFEDMDIAGEGAAIFHRSMLELTRGSAPDIAAAIDWKGVERVCDIGGGYGALLCGVLEAQPSLHGSVLDLEHARAGALSWFAERGVAARASFVTGSFFDRPPPPADVYLLKSVIHDWDDEKSVKILRRCREAMGPAARLVLVEAPAPPPGAASAGGMEWVVAFSDLNMLVNVGGRERTEAQYRAVLEAAGLRVTAVRPTGGFYSVFEAVRTLS